jgi:hypothetical protein
MFFVQGLRFQGFEKRSISLCTFPYKAFFKAFCINKGLRAAARLLLKNFRRRNGGLTEQSTDFQCKMKEGILCPNVKSSRRRCCVARNAGH